MIFECNFWGVVKVDMVHDSDGSVCERDTIASLEGLWDTEVAARKWAAQQNPRTGKPAYWKPGDDWSTDHYIVVRTHDLKARCLEKVEDMMEEAAKLSALGVSDARG